MKAKLIVAALTFVTGTSMFALAGEAQTDVKVFHSGSSRTVMVNIEKEDDGDAKVDLNINGEEYSFDLPELEVGETHEIITNDGQVIKLIKLEKGTSVDIDGESMLLHISGSEDAHFNKDHGRMVKLFAFGGVGNPHDDDSLVITASGLDDDARARIKDAIAATGIEKKVIFAETNMQWFSDGEAGENIEIIIDDDGNEVHKAYKIKKKILIKTEENDS